MSTLPSVIAFSPSERPSEADIPVDGRFAPKAALGRLEIQLPLYPRKQTLLGNRGMSEKCRFCCKSRLRQAAKRDSV